MKLYNLAAAAFLLFLSGCQVECETSRDQDTLGLKQALLGDLRVMKLPSTGRCYAYTWVTDLHFGGSAVVFEVPCDTVDTACDDRSLTKAEKE